MESQLLDQKICRKKGWFAFLVCGLIVLMAVFFLSTGAGIVANVATGNPGWFKMLALTFVWCAGLIWEGIELRALKKQKIKETVS